MKFSKILSFVYLLVVFSCTNAPKEKAVIEWVEQDAPVVSSVKFVPDEQDREKFAILKSQIAEVDETVKIFLAEEGNGNYKALQYVSNKYLTNLYEAMAESATLNEFLTQKKQASYDYKKEINTIGLTIGYSLIDDYGHQDDQVAFEKINNRILKLINADIISKFKPVRSGNKVFGKELDSKYKAFEKELNAKMTPAKGFEDLKINVDESGNITIDGSKIGTAVESTENHR